MNEFVGEGHQKRLLHKLGGKQFEYKDELLKMAGFDKFPSYYQEMYEKTSTIKKTYRDSYRDYGIADTRSTHPETEIPAYPKL